MSQPVLLYAAVCGLILVGLSIFVIQGRATTGIGMGDGGNPMMLRRMRIHANFIEYVPLALVLMYFVQQSGFSLWIVHVLGVVLIVARVVHIMGLLGSAGKSQGRVTGVLGTFAVILAASALSALAAFGVRF